MDVIYIDIVLFLTICFNGVLLYVTGKLAKRKITFSNWILATFVATLYVLIDIFIGDFTLSLFLNIIFAILINYLMFGKMYLWKHIGLFYFLTFLLGGMIIAFHQFLPTIGKMKTFFLLVQNYSGSQTSMTLLFISILFFIFFARWQMHAHIRTNFFQSFMYDISIRITGRTYTTKAFLDSGNQLVDPLTNKPVIIVEEDFMRTFFNQMEWNVFKTACIEQDLTKLNEDVRKIVQIVPFQGVQGGQDMLYAIQPESILIYHENKVYETKHVLIGIQFGTLSNEHAYQCLLHPDLLHLHLVQAA